MNRLLILTRPLFAIDTESTGVDPQKDRIVEIAFAQWTAEGMVKEWQTRINPGISIPAAASKIHGIFDADVVGKPTFKQLAANLAGGFSNCDFCGQNCRFDLRILSAEFARASVSWSYSSALIIDSYQLERLAVPRSLSHLHEKYVGLKYDGAHGALSDVRAAATVIVKQLEAHPSLPRDVAKLHELQWLGQIDADGKFRMVDGVPCFAQWGKYANRPMREADVGYWDVILSKDFSAEVKALAAEAKMGRFPGGVIMS